MAVDELKVLLHVLDERDIALGHDDVAWAFQGSKTTDQSQAWVRGYLTDSCLLSKEEITFYEKHGKHSSKRTGDTVFSGRPLTDADFEAAITSLEASTAAIEQQSKLLQAQKEALHELRSRHSMDNDPNQGHDQRLKRLARERTQLEFENNELSDSIRLRLETSQRQTEASSTGLPSGVDRILDKDDRLLDGLQSVIPKLETSDESDKQLAEIERLCQSLNLFLAQEIRTRIDATYKSTIASSTDADSTVAPNEEDKAHAGALRAELNELSTEISSLASMAVDTEHRIPLKRALASRRYQAQNDQANWTLYIADTLQQLTTRLEALDEHVHNLQMHRSALSQASTAFETITAKASSAKNPSPEKPSPARQFQQSLKPLRVAQMQGAHGSNSQQNQKEPHDPASALLRHLEIRNPATTNPSTAAEALSQAVHARSRRLAELESSTERAISDQIASALGKASRDEFDLLRAVHIHSPYGKMSLDDGEAQKLVQALEMQTQELGRAMRELDVARVADEAVDVLQEKGLL